MPLRVLSAGCLALAAVIGLLNLNSQAQQDPYGDFIARTPPRTPEEEKKSFHLPPGFDIELVACEPDIIKPINMSFDDRGRLWVTQSVEYPFPVPADRKGRDTVKIFNGFYANGRAAGVTTFVDGLNIPIGVLPMTGGALVYSIPNIYFFGDSKHRDHADSQELFYGSVGRQDTHGMTSAFTWGFDGWIYACHGYANTSVMKGKDGKAVTMNSGNTYRMRPDGSHLEQFTHGQVNPFGLCFDALGNLYSADCHTRPVMMLLRDGYYESFGKPNDGLGFAPEMCDHDHGSTAIAGIVYYAADHFPPEYRDTVFMGNVVTNRINHDRLEPHGSTLKAVETKDFLVSDDPWFRPVDLKLGPDGAMYVADFYNRIIGHYEVPLTHPGRDRTRGRIWRIVYRGPAGKGDPALPRSDWSKATVPELIDDLAHPNLVVRVKATNQLVERGAQEAVGAAGALFRSKSSPFQRMHGLWTLERLHALDTPTLQTAARDNEAGVRVHAMRVLAERPQLGAVERELVLYGLKDRIALVERCAADALGRHPSAENLEPLLTLRRAVPADDTHLLYMVRAALRDQLLSGAVWKEFETAAWSVSDRQAVADVATGVHSPEAAAYLLTHLKTVFEGSNETRERYVHHIARYGSDQVVAALLDFCRQPAATPPRQQAALFKAIQQGTEERGAPLADAARQWAEQLASRLLQAPEAEDFQAGAELAKSLKSTSAQDRLAAVAEQKTIPEAERKAAFEALLAIDAGKHTALAGRALDDPSEPMALREHLARLLAFLNQPAGRAELVKALAVAPAQLQTTIAGALAGSHEGATELLEAVKTGKASARLLQEWGVHLHFNNYADLKDQVARLTAGLPSADQKLQALLTKRRDTFAKTGGNAAQGARVFEKSCANCHQLGGKGAKIGPQLDGVGVRGVDRLLEDVIDPNRNVDQAFRATTLGLKNGQVLSGLVLREEGEIVVLADSQGKEIRIPKTDIEQRTVSPLSPMPANLVDQIPEADFYNLLAYLLSQRPPPGDKAGLK
jgi:putative heme-binding domain-containing protein